jgi:hypothetical protein
MTRAFVITLVLDDNQPLAQVAADLLDDLTDAGYTVETVNPFGGEELETRHGQPSPFGGSFLKPPL